MLVVFRSLVVALTSILMNVLSVGAAFGFATIVFQQSIGTGLLGIHHQVFVDAWALLFFCALLFGLSMDCRLFLLAAISERYEATGDTRRAIAEGIARTGPPNTNAALIMIVMFIAFGVTRPIQPTELGLTLAMAVLLEATVVRVSSSPPRGTGHRNANPKSQVGTSGGVRSGLLTMCADRALATASAKRSPDLGHVGVGGRPGRGCNRTPPLWSW